ncbi:mannose-1-phosphate guanylyltransferase [uncultured Clostridium sp.]|uniref:mannose-1-phosphate guanylyltransferase n=1 Tax=uncultured Clostridium sp. TaxID=59620 RepID=UPI002619E6C8|nr:mannose-1-phosphate guanylyltransferase [uncultured Clostridium sp.]
MLCALIMAGGKGTRFWPLSTEDKPKQFLNLIGDKTMIQMTVDRILPIIPIDRIYICTGERYVDLIKEQVPNLPIENIIIEPEGRNTAPCITLSSLVIKRKYKDATMVVLPSDHLIENEDKFRNIILEAEQYLNVNTKGIVTLGMSPTRPETGYGYIKYDNNTNIEVLKVDKFVEKPNKETAEKYLKEGKYLWNGGIFLWKVNTILDEVKKYIPSIYEVLSEIEHVNDEDLQRLINNQYSKTDEISIDYAVLEKSNDIYVIKSDIGWDDIGTWMAMERYREKDNYENIYGENTISIDSRNSLVIGNSDKRVIMIGVDNIATIVSDDGIYIVKKSLLENIKDFKEKI